MMSPDERLELVGVWYEIDDDVDVDDGGVVVDAAELSEEDVGGRRVVSPGGITVP
jgi:hypothetical protein